MSLLFVFDMDQVLYDYNWAQRMSGMTQLTGHSLERLRELWWHQDGEMAAEAGAFGSAEEYLDAFCDAIDCEVEREDWLRLRADAMTPWPDSIAAVRRASEFGQVTLLTNNGPLTGENLHRVAPELVDLFGDHLFASSFYGARKPDPVVFERVLARYDVAAADTFFADDMPENVAGAASVGIAAHHFTSAAGMRAAIEEFADARGRSAA